MGARVCVCDQSKTSLDGMMLEAEKRERGLTIHPSIHLRLSNFVYSARSVCVYYKGTTKSNRGLIKAREEGAGPVWRCGIDVPGNV